MSASEYGSGPSTRPGIGDLAYWAALDGTTGYDRVAARSNVDPLPPCLGDRVPSRRAEQIGGPVSFVTDDTSNGRDCFDLEDPGSAHRQLSLPQSYKCGITGARFRAGPLVVAFLAIDAVGLCMTFGITAA